MGRDLTTIPIQGYEEFYTISECGKIHRIAKMNRYKEVIPFKEPKLCNSAVSSGRLRVSLCAFGKVDIHVLNRLVYRHFKGKLTRFEKVVHLDGDIYNCHVDNLKKEAIKSGLRPRQKTK